MTSLTQMLTEELRMAKQLLTLLQQEESILLADETEDLLSITQTKSQLVGELSVISQQRLSHVNHLGCTGQENGMQQWLDIEANTSSKNTWELIITTATIAKELNRTNGLLVNRLAARNQNALASLQGYGGASTSLYGPTGKNSMTSSTRMIVG